MKGIHSMKRTVALIFSLLLFSTVFGQNWKYLNESNSNLPSNAISNIFFDDDGSVWFCTQDKGLIHYNGSTFVEFNSSTNDDFNADWVNAITKTSGDVYWVATEYDGLYKFQNGIWTQYTSDEAGHSLDHIRVLALQNDGPDNTGGALWIGTWSNGLLKYDGSNWELYDYSSGVLPDNSVHAIAVEENPDPLLNEATIWFGTGNGLVKFDGANWEIDSIGNATDKWVNAIAFENGGITYGNGKMYVGTDFGEFCIYDGSSWDIYNMADAWNPNNSITSIVIDKDGIKWFGTDEEGLGMYDGTQLLLYYKDNSGIAGNDVISLATRENNDSTEVWISAYDIDIHNYTGISILTQARVTGIEKKKIVPGYFALYQNYPNPFNPSTTIRLQVPKTSHITLKVFDLSGREVSTLLDERKSPGHYEVKFDGSNLASGVYLYQLSNGSVTKTQKMILIK